MHVCIYKNIYGRYVLKYIQTCSICCTICHVLYYSNDINYYCIQIKLEKAIHLYPKVFCSDSNLFQS